MTTFSRIKIEHNWRQFSNVDIDLSNKMTVLTGANGCGKTTLMTILSSHFGWNINFVSTPFLSKRQKKKLYSDFKILFNEVEENNNEIEIGSINYTDGSSCSLKVPSRASNNIQYQLSYANRQGIEGLYIPSHRPPMNYQHVASIPTDPKTNQQHYQEFQNLLSQSFSSGKAQNPGLVLKQSLISLALFGYGNNAVASNSEYISLYEKFEEVLRVMLPETLGFLNLEIRMPEIVLITTSGTFSIDAMSGGVNSLFGIAWQIHMYGANADECTVLIDEPENHLHPSLQRTFLPNLAKAFPEYKFIIATHSPFIVSSNQNASVYALTYNEENKIVSELLEEADLTGSPDKVLRDILDVPTTIPVWVEEKIKAILHKHEQGFSPENPELISEMFNELKELGLNESLFDFYQNKKSN
jgi:predicted ATPase